jgi:GMP synthase-like glutamine amidotransferase
MNDNQPNQGIRCLKQLVTQHGLEPVVFEARYKNDYPDLADFDIYLSSGGPGDPTTCLDTDWGLNFSSWIDALWAYNKGDEGRKYAFMICHSFQMLILHWQLATVNKRKSTSFGILPCHKVESPLSQDVLLEGLEDPFYIVDSRDFQIVQPDLDKMMERGAEVVCLEKIRDHVPYERAVMGMRFSPEVFGTQFHPEADVESMKYYLYNPEKEAYVKERYGLDKYNEMVRLIDQPEAVQATNARIIPSFLDFAVYGTLQAV